MVYLVQLIGHVGGGVHESDPGVDAVKLLHELGHQTVEEARVFSLKVFVTLRALHWLLQHTLTYFYPWGIEFEYQVY